MLLRQSLKRHLLCQINAALQRSTTMPCGLRAWPCVLRTARRIPDAVVTNLVRFGYCMAKLDPSAPESEDRFSRIIGRSRFVVLLAVVAVMLVAVSLFLLGTIQAVTGVWDAWKSVFRGGMQSTMLTVAFLEIVSTMLKAVVFYIIGVGLYSLFVSPLNITVSLGVQTLNDLESKVVNVVVVILSITFLEHFILWKDPLATLQFGGAAALVVAALVLFERHSHQSKEEQSVHNPKEQVRAQKSMFKEDHEKADLPLEEPEHDHTSHADHAGGDREDTMHYDDKPDGNRRRAGARRS